MALPLTTDQPDRTVAPAERTVARSFLIERLGSLLAFFPLGIWTAVHLWNQLAAFSGARVWEESVTAHASPATTMGRAGRVGTQCPSPMSARMRSRNPRKFSSSMRATCMGRARIAQLARRYNEALSLLDLLARRALRDPRDCVLPR